MNYQAIDFILTCQNINIGRQWLISMGNAALFNIDIQYCMSLPRHALQSLEINRVTQTREILIATLSTDPVAVGDGINYVDTTRIRRCCRQDGLILKPSQPLTMIDLLISDWTINKGVLQGELYSTKTIINDQIFSIIFASSMKRNYSLILSMIGSSSGIIWSFDNPYEIFTFDDNNSLQISNNKCNDTLYCLWYSSHLWHFNDSILTKYAFMGEINKWTYISRQKFSSLYTNSANSQMTIIVESAPNELVDLLVYHSKFESIIHLICHFSTDKLQAQLTINSTNVTCL